MSAQESRNGVIEHRIGANGLFTLATSSGAIDLHGVDGDTVRIATADPEDAVLLDRFEVEAGDGFLRVRSTRGVLIGVGVFGRQFRWGAGVGELDLIVEMPRSARLELGTISGDVHVADVDGPQHYKTVSGGLELSGVSGEIEVDATSAGVTIESAAPTALRLRTISGDVAVRGPAIRRLEATTMSGDIRIESAFEAGPEHSIETVSGDTRLVTGSGLTIEARTVSGDIRSDAPHRTGGGPGRRAIIVGDGKARLHFRSLSGDLQLVGRGTASTTTEGAAWRGSVDAPRAPEAPSAPKAPAAPQAPAAPATATDDPLEASRLEILRALGAHEIDVAEATARLAALDREAQP
ncbi:MAG: DUF4097 family beta strand repeat-containing protein [Candidatus Limnocylindrales bacterium]